MKLKFCLPALAILLCSGISVAADIPITKIASVNKLKVFDSFSFGDQAPVFRFKENSRTFTYKGVQMPLGFIPTKQRGSIALNPSDYQLHIRPFLSSGCPKYKQIKTIVIDPGHGGSDLGTVSVVKGLTEKTLAMDVSLRIANMLRDQGYRVVLTRTNDKKIELRERTAIANRNKADLFICIHFNSAPSHSANGIETFVLTPVNQPSSYQKKSESHRDKTDGNRFDPLNILLGYCVQSSLLKATCAKDRGVKHARYTVLRHLQCPGVLIECGFLSNSTEAKKIASNEYREKIAHAIVAGILSFDKAAN